MLIKVKVMANAGENLVEQKSPDSYLVYTKSKPIAGSANRSVRLLLANFFAISIDKIYLVRGSKTTNKLFEVK